MTSVHPVAQVLRLRREEGSKPGSRSDGYRVALAVEGGGMRGIVSGAMMTVLRDQGLEDAFDDIYAVSAGAVNSAYFLAGYGWYGLSIYYDDLIGGEFFDPRRALRGQPALSLDYVTSVVMETLKPLDFDVALASPVRLHIAASSVDAMSPRDFTGFGSKEQLKATIRASTCLPLVAGPPVVIDGERFLDGGILLPHPFVVARDDRCTHVLVLSTRSSSAFRSAPTAAQRFIAWRLDRLRPGLGERYIGTLKGYGVLRREIKGLSDRGVGPPFVLDVACPEGSHQVSRLTQERGALFEGIRAGYSSMIDALEGESRRTYLRPALAD